MMPVLTNVGKDGTVCRLLPFAVRTPVTGPDLQDGRALSVTTPATDTAVPDTFRCCSRGTDDRLDRRTINLGPATASGRHQQDRQVGIRDGRETPCSLDNKLKQLFLPTPLSATLKRTGASVRARHPLDKQNLTHLRRNDSPKLNVMQLQGLPQSSYNKTMDVHLFFERKIFWFHDHDANPLLRIFTIT